ncbi:STAS domain-containing protein [Streptomyces sp. NPDC023723]|uniref:STAS domain-containing protein n=1 Tax=Streptomyces sp. NPDC023723 TaxID=3154323 RepID=UPI0033CC8019
MHQKPQASCDPTPTPIPIPAPTPIPIPIPAPPPAPASVIQQSRIYETAGRTVVQLLGEIDFAVVLRIAARLDTLTESPGPDVVIDLRLVGFLDCSGLGLLCRARRRVEERGGRLTLTGASPGIRKLLRIVELHRTFEAVDTLGEALDVRPRPEA